MLLKRDVNPGPSMVLLSKAYRLLADELIYYIVHIELSCRKDLTEYFISDTDFPE